MFLVNSRYHPLSATPFRSRSKSFHVPGAHLLPKLRCQFAEFLNQGLLKRLRILSSSTCVGLRYGQLNNSFRGFSCQHGINHFASKRTRHHLSVLASRICLRNPPTGLNHLIQQMDDLPFCVPPSLKRCSAGTGMLTCFPSPTPFGLGLGAD